MGAIEDASSNLRNALKGTDIEEIKKKTQDLVQASMKLGEAIYKSQQSAKPGDAPKDEKKEEGKKDDNVVDADFFKVCINNIIVFFSFFFFFIFWCITWLSTLLRFINCFT